MAETVDTAIRRLTLASDDPRSLRALELAAGAASWLERRTPDGALARAIPSQRMAGRFYTATTTACDCADAQEQPQCKYMLAVALYEVLTEARLPVLRPAR